MTRAFDNAARAFVEGAEENSSSDARLVRFEAWDEGHKLAAIAHKLLLAIETYQMELRSLDYVGEPVASPVELIRLIFDYDQDEIGHKASDVLRASVEEG